MTDTACLEYCLTEEERREFEQNGFFVVEDALPPPLVEELVAVVDRLDAQYRNARALIILQQVTIVAGDLDHQAVGAE